MKQKIFQIRNQSKISLWIQITIIFFVHKINIGKRAQQATQRC